jgi:hypothetical protein
LAWSLAVASHAELLGNMGRVRAALVGRFKWFIHASPDVFIPGIRKDGIRPNRDLEPPEEVQQAVPSSDGSISCLYPVGATRWPRPASATLVLPIGQDPKFVRYGISSGSLPELVNADWSNAWNYVEAYLAKNPLLSVEDTILNIATEYGSVASYDRTPPERLVVCCVGQPHSDPTEWRLLQSVQDEEIASFD